jgi:hypothetical protein
MDAQGNFEYPEHEGAYHILCNLDTYIDSLQEKHVSDDFEKALTEMICNAQKCVVEPIVVAQQWKDYLVHLAKSEKPVKDRFVFKAIPRLLDMIEPTDKAKSYVTKLADAFDSEGYYTDAKIVRESLKIMNGEKVAMATMDEEPANEELEKIVEEITEPTVLNAYGTKELARRLCNTVIYGTSVSEELDEVAELYTLDDSIKPWRNLTKEAFKAGANWQKLQDMGITNKAQNVVANVLSSADNPLDAYATEVAFIMLPATLKESYHQTNRNRIGDAVKLGAKWQFERVNEALLSEVLPCFMHGGEADEVVAKLDEVLNQKK